VKIIGSDSEYKLCQWANDWITADGPNGRGVVLDPTKCIFTDAEMSMLCNPNNNYGSGCFWDRYEQAPNNRLRRRK
jgi:hypothetical protein